jgi:zinc protease
MRELTVCEFQEKPTDESAGSGGESMLKHANKPSSAGFHMLSRVLQHTAPKVLLALLLLGSVAVWAQQSNVEPIQLPPIKTVTLENGLKVLVIEQPSLPIVQFSLRVRAGAIHEPTDRTGLATFTAMMLRQGTTNRTADQISEAIDFVGGSLGASADVERTDVTARVLKKDFQVGLDLLADIVQNPNFPEKEMGIVRNQLLASVRGMRDDPSELASAHLDFALFGTIHPLGRSMSEQSVNAITRDDLVTFHGIYYRPNNAVLAVAGDVKADEVIAAVKKAFGSWQKGDIPPAPLPEPVKLQGYKVRFVHKPGQTQTHIEIGHFGLAVTDPDYIPTVLANYVLGGGAFSSRLLQIIRSKAGKTYSIFSYFPSYSFPGYFRISTFTRNDQAFETLQLVLDEFKKFKENGITKEELQAAQDNIAGSYILRLETLSGLTTTILNNDFYGFSMDRSRNWRKLVRSVTLEQANKAIKDRFDPENLAIVLLSDVKILEGRTELLPGLLIESVGVVDWLEPVTARAKPYAEFLAALAAPKGPTQLEWKAQITPEAKALLERAFAAQGGFERVAQIRDIYSKARGSVFRGGREVQREEQTWIKLPNKVKATLKSPGLDVVLVYDGNRVWAQIGGQVRDMTAQLLASIRDSIELDTLLFLWNIAREGYKFEVIRKDHAEGREVQILRMNNEQGKSADFYIDIERAVPLKVITLDEEGKQAEKLLGDYRQVEGFWIPFLQKTLVDKELVSSLEIIEFKINTGVGDEQFEKP